MRTTKHLGIIKERIQAALVKSDEICNVLIGDTTDLSMADRVGLFKHHVKSHLFVDNTLVDDDSYIYFDVVCYATSPQIKECKVILYTICGRGSLERANYDGYYGNRADVLAEMVEDRLINDASVAKQFGIGKLTLDKVDIYNTQNYYGRVLTMTAPEFM